MTICDHKIDTSLLYSTNKTNIEIHQHTRWLEYFLCKLYEYFWMFSKKRFRLPWISSAVMPWISSPFWRRCGWVSGVGWPNVSLDFCKRDSRWSDSCNDSLLTLEDGRLGTSNLNQNFKLIFVILRPKMIFSLHSVDAFFRRVAKVTFENNFLIKLDI